MEGNKIKLVCLMLCSQPAIWYRQFGKSVNGKEKVILGGAVEGHGLKCATSAIFQVGEKIKPRSLQTWVVGQIALALT